MMEQYSKNEKLAPSEDKESGLEDRPVEYERPEEDEPPLIYDESEETECGLKIALPRYRTATASIAEIKDPAEVIMLLGQLSHAAMQLLQIALSMSRIPADSKSDIKDQMKGVTGELKRLGVTGELPSLSDPSQYLNNAMRLKQEIDNLMQRLKVYRHNAIMPFIPADIVSPMGDTPFEVRGPAGNYYFHSNYYPEWPATNESAAGGKPWFAEVYFDGVKTNWELAKSFTIPDSGLVQGMLNANGEYGKRFFIVSSLTNPKCVARVDLHIEGLLQDEIIDLEIDRFKAIEEYGIRVEGICDLVKSIFALMAIACEFAGFWTSLLPVLWPIAAFLQGIRTWLRITAEGVQVLKVALKMDIREKNKEQRNNNILLIQKFPEREPAGKPSEGRALRRLR